MGLLGMGMKEKLRVYVRDSGQRSTWHERGRTNVSDLDEIERMMMMLSVPASPVLWRKARHGELASRSVPRNQGLGWPSSFLVCYFEVEVVIVLADVSSTRLYMIEI